MAARRYHRQLPAPCRHRALRGQEFRAQLRGHCEARRRSTAVALANRCARLWRPRVIAVPPHIDPRISSDRNVPPSSAQCERGKVERNFRDLLLRNIVEIVFLVLHFIGCRRSVTPMRQRLTATRTGAVPHHAAMFFFCSFSKCSWRGTGVGDRNLARCNWYEAVTCDISLRDISGSLKEIG